MKINKTEPIYPAYCDSDKKREQFAKLKQDKKKNKELIDNAHAIGKFGRMLKDEITQR